MCTNLQNPLIPIILILTIAAGMDFEQALPHRPIRTRFAE